MTGPPDTGPILVAVDFSEDSVEALNWAAHQADLQGAALVILHVIHDPAASPGFYHKPDQNWLRPLADVAQDMMDEFVAKPRREHPQLACLASAEARLVSGLPGGRIAEIASEIGARMVVVGSRGRTGLQSILLGSVAQRVAQTCAVPVVIVKSPKNENRQESAV